MENVPHRIICHHTADPAQAPQAAKVDAYHKSRGFTLSARGFYIGYHYLIEYDGTIVQARNDNEIGCHAYAHNQNTLGVCLAGNFDVDLPTPAQVAAFKTLLQRLATTYGIGKADIIPHRLVGQTHCNGMRLADSWAAGLLAPAPLADIIARLEQILIELKSQ